MIVDWSGWAGDILDCLDDTTTATGSVVCFLQNSIGVMNAKIGARFALSGDTSEEINPVWSNIESGILTEMYICNSYRKASIAALGAGSAQVTSIEDAEGAKIKLVSKAETAKVARGLYSDCCVCLDDLTNWYKKNYTKAQPSQVLYNERTGNAWGVGCPVICPPDGMYSSTNFVFTR